MTSKVTALLLTGTTKVTRKVTTMGDEMRGSTRRAWVKVFITGWLHGSIRWQLEPEERSVWADLLCLAGECNKDGLICDNDGKAYPTKYIANTLNINEELLIRTINKSIEDQRIEKVNDGVFKITNWSCYQSEYQRQKKYRNKEELIDETADDFKEKYGHLVKKG